MLQHATHGQEGSEDHDSIRGGCKTQCMLQRRKRCGMGRNHQRARTLQAQALVQILELHGGGGTRHRQVGEAPGIDDRRPAAEDGFEVLVVHGAEDRVGECAEMSDYFFPVSYLTLWGWFDCFFHGRDELIDDIANEENQ